MYNGSKKDKGEAIHRKGGCGNAGVTDEVREAIKRRIVKGKPRENQGGTSENKWEENK